MWLFLKMGPVVDLDIMIDGDMSILSGPAAMSYGMEGREQKVPEDFHRPLRKV